MMRNISTTYLIIWLVLVADPPGASGQKSSTVADSAGILAKEYEMKQNWFVMLVRGARRAEITGIAAINRLQEGHNSECKPLAALGKQVVAGPFGYDGNWRCIFHIRAASKQEVEGYLKTDPAIASGRIDYEIHSWWTAKGTVLK